MSRTRWGAGSRTILAAGVALAIGAGTLVTAAPASATPAPTASPTATASPRPTGTALTAEITGTSTLTLPAKDHLRDSTSVRIRSGAKGTVDVIATRGKKAVLLADDIALVKRSSGWQRTVSVSVADLPVGPWLVRVRRTADHGVRAVADARLHVGTGKPVQVRVVPAARSVYPYRDGVLDRADVTVTATDETGAALPLDGTVRLDLGKKHRTRDLSSKGVASLPVTGLALGAATLTATVEGPAGKPVTRTTGLTLAPTGVGAMTLTRSSDTLQPVKDGFLDAETFTVGGGASADSPAAVSGTLTVTLGKTVVQRWAVPDGTLRTFTWDGRTNGVIVPGTYTATLSLRGPEGVAKTKAKTVLVTKDHLPYVVQDLFGVSAGNQQGLAVHDGVFYVGFDNGDDTSRIETFDSKGVPLQTLGPIDIGHAAELSYSTVTGLLYAANGGAKNPTTVWAVRTDWDAATIADPQTAVVDTIDLSALGNNGMIAVDDARSQLLVFSGTSPNYTVTPVSLWASSDTGTHLIGTPMPITITGVPQGLEVVGSQLWVYTSLKGRNHLAKYDLPGTMSPTAAGGTDADLMWSGEGEGLGVDTVNGLPAYYVGAHDTNRIGILVPVADE